MAQYPANINLSGLDGTNGFRLDGGAAGNYSGNSVASAGDVNGDGFADLIVGAASAYTSGFYYTGASYVVFGQAAGFGATLDLSTLDGGNGFRLSGVAANDETGDSVASAGDVNGDGFADLIVGAHFADPNGSYSGASYVVFGHAGGFAANLDLSALDGSNGFRLRGAAGDYSGASVASAGDINGDGFADLIIGADGADSNGSNSGSSYVVFGKSSGFGANLDLSSLNGSDGFRLIGAAAGDASGASVASAGDVNGDGFADLIVGARLADSNSVGDSGASFVVFGKASGFDPNISLAALDGSDGFRINGIVGGDRSGRSVASAGDLNADGFADLIIGADGADPHGAGSGASFVVFGTGDGFAATVQLSDLDGTNGFKLSGGALNDAAGWSVASAGDVNGDGFADVIVGAREANPNGGDSGASYVVFGKASGFAANIDLTGLNGVNGFRLSGVALNDHSGQSVASAGDLNGDGFGDLIVGAHLADPNGTSSGSSYVVFGRLPDRAVTRTGTDIGQTIAGGNFGDGLDGRGGDDTLFGHGGDDALVGGLGNDTLFGGAGFDELAGGTGNDLLSGGGDDDELEGGTGSDRLSGGDGDDDLDGGTGLDTADYSGAGSGVTVSLSVATEQDTFGAGIDILFRIENLTGSAFVDRLTGSGAANVLTGLAGNDTLVGGGGNDTLVGGDDNDTLNGGIGADQMSGGSGADRLIGGDGDDMLNGGSERDVMTGGGGNDVFVFLAASDSGATGATRDAISDFTTGDVIDLAAIDADIATVDDEAFSFIGTAGFSNTAGELRQFASGANTVVAGDIDGDGVGDFQIQINGSHTLGADDFLL